MLYQLYFLLSATCLGVAGCLSTCVYLLSGDSTCMKRTVKVGVGIVVGVSIGLAILCVLSLGI